MLQSFFLWFYCLNLAYSVLLVLACIAAYLLLRRLYGRKRFWRPVITAFFLIWLLVIATATLSGRSPSMDTAAPQLLPFHSYRKVLAGGSREILRSNLMNVLLFYPAGLLGCELLQNTRPRSACVHLSTILGALCSMAIELCQYFFALGQFEADDVLHNTLGVLFGALVSLIALKRVPDEHNHRL